MQYMSVYSTERSNIYGNIKYTNIYVHRDDFKVAPWFVGYQKCFEARSCAGVRSKQRFRVSRIYKVVSVHKYC